ncbi:MAG: CotH kinase family protein [Rikenellaceae bacterium]
MKHKLLFLSLALFALTACEEASVVSTEIQEITFLSDIGELSKVSDSSFESGDKISVMATDDSGVVQNATYTFSNSVFSSSDPITKEEGEKLSFRATYPTCVDIEGGFDFTIAADQSSDGYELSDLLVSTLDATIAEQPSLTFEHRLSNVVTTFELTDGTAIMPEGVKFTAQNTVKCDIANDTYQGDGTFTKITAKENGSLGYVAILAPQTIEAGDNFVTVTYGGVAISAALTMDATFESGVQYTYEIVIDSQTSTIVSIDLIGAVISGWEDPTVNEDDEEDDEEVNSDYPDWTDATHSKSVDPNFDIVFQQNVVLRIDLTISAENWEIMWDDLDENLGSTSSGPGGNNPNGGGNNTTLVDFDPVFVPCNFNFGGTNWYEVGVRFKGNSSLSTAYSSGTEKLSFKLDFDEFEDDYPALKNQRFYGFKQLNLNNNYNDLSFMRDKVVSDLFRNFGVACSNTAFCELYIDLGNGPEYFGLYTIVEEVDDTVITTQFDDNDNNLYKPDGDAATFAKGTYDTDEFYVKNNEDNCDFSDMLALYNILHDSSRTSNQTAWKAELESILDVDMFLKWLAANVVIQNWDTYGNMSHNYYLYNSPKTGLLTWIPWDNNEALKSGSGTSALGPNLSSVSSSWPLISYIIAVDEYEEIYENYMQEFIDYVFVVSDMTTLYSSYYTLLKDYAYAEVSGRSFLSRDSEFDSAVSTLKTHVSSRYTTITNYLK